MILVTVLAQKKTINQNRSIEILYAETAGKGMLFALQESAAPILTSNRFICDQPQIVDAALVYRAQHKHRSRKLLSVQVWLDDLRAKKNGINHAHHCIENYRFTAESPLHALTSSNTDHSQCLPLARRHHRRHAYTGVAG